MGSIEDLSGYDEVMTRLAAWLRPGGTVYLDFAAVDRRFGVPSFITKYVWPGAFRMVYLPSFTRALAKHHFDIVEMRNDRRNYHLWGAGRVRALDAPQRGDRGGRRRDDLEDDAPADGRHGPRDERALDEGNGLPRCNAAARAGTGRR